MSVPARNLVKPFAIGGLIFGVIYGALVCLAPNLKGTPAPPVDAMVLRICATAIFMGPFGAAVGTGLGLLANGIQSKLRRGKDEPLRPVDPRNE